MRNIVAKTMLTCLRGAMVAHQTSNLGVAGSIPAVSVLQKMFFEDFNFLIFFSRTTVSERNVLANY